MGSPIVRIGVDVGVEPRVIQMYKEDLRKKFRLEYGNDLDEELMEETIDEVVKENFYDPKAELRNSYANKVCYCNLSEIIEYIYKYTPIIGGNGVLFYRHSQKENPTVDWISFNLDDRQRVKQEMFKAEMAGDEERRQEMAIKQLNIKIKINSWYGCSGYKLFIFYTVELAPSTTLCGQNIISTAAMAFEGFIADNVPFVNSTEAEDFILNCNAEANRDDRLMYLHSSKIPDVTDGEVIERIITRCKFDIDDGTLQSFKEMVKNSSQDAKKLMLYKNNLYAFCRLPKMMEMIRTYMSGITDLLVPNIEEIKNDEAKQCLNEFWEYLRCFVAYEYPCYDRVRRNKYTNKKAVLYEDTDSNFLSLAKWVNFIDNEVMFNSSDAQTHTAVNTFCIFISRLVATAFEVLLTNMNVEPEYHKYLVMKNEFYYSRILFVKKKKRYIGLQVIQEGVLLNNGNGKMDIKGFDFKKSTTKPTLRKFYETLSHDEIIAAKEINIKRIFTKIIQLEKSIRDSLMSGDTQYYKQSNIKRPDEYARPFSIQGVKAVMLWNTLNPTYSIELPSDVDIIPITLEAGRRKTPKKLDDLDYVYLETDAKTGKPMFMCNDTKNLRDFADKYPEEYERLDKEIFHNQNKDIRSMKLNFIAKPKNPDIPIPQWFFDIIDADKIVNDGLKLFNPVLDTLGIRIMKTSSTNEHYTNIINL